MKVRFVLFVLFSLLFSIPIHAIEKQIFLHCSEYEDQWTKDNRSLSNTPVATHDGQKICIYSEKELENVHLRVRDAQGNVVFAQHVSSILGCYVFHIEYMGDEQLTLIVESGTVCDEGDVSL